MKEILKSENDEERITLYFVGVSISYVAMVGGLIVFIMLLIDIPLLVLGSVLNAYLSSALGFLLTFLHKPLTETGFRKFFIFGSVFFLLVSILMLFNYMGF